MKNRILTINEHKEDKLSGFIIEYVSTIKKNQKNKKKNQKGKIKKDITQLIPMKLITTTIIYNSHHTINDIPYLYID